MSKAAGLPLDQFWTRTSAWHEEGIGACMSPPAVANGWGGGGGGGGYYPVPFARNDISLELSEALQKLATTIRSDCCLR